MGLRTLFILFLHPGLFRFTSATEGHENITVSLEALQDGTHAISDEEQRQFAVDTDIDHFEGHMKDGILDESVGDASTDRLIRMLVATLAKNERENDVGRLERMTGSHFNRNTNPVKRINGAVVQQKEEGYVDDDNGDDDNDDRSTGDGRRGELKETPASRERDLDRLKSKLIRLIPVFHPTVTVAVTDPKVKDAYHSIRVPLAADMNVLQSLIAAARAYIKKHGRERDIPYNVILDWSTRQRCFTVVEALGVRNRRRARWYLSIQNSFNKVIYNGQCLVEDWVLRPDWMVKLTYTRTNKGRMKSFRTRSSF